MQPEPDLANGAPVSAVIPCYRCRDTIAASVASIAAQTRVPREVVLVDDCSGDGTVEALHALAARYPAGWIQVVALEENRGPSAARNAGWARASQDYIAFLDADDSWAPRKIELQLDALAADPGLALVAHRMVVRERGLPLPQVQPPVRVQSIGRRHILFKNQFPTASVMLRRDLPFRFDERFRRVEDFLLWSQIVLNGHRSAKLNQTLAVWHKPTYGAGGLTADLAAMHRAGREVRLELLRQGLVTPAEHAAVRAIGIVRRARQRLVLAGRRIAGAAVPRRAA
jgi:glycosyltransferase involved in cell wall biosynthesis